MRNSYSASRYQALILKENFDLSLWFGFSLTFGIRCYELNYNNFMNETLIFQLASIAVYEVVVLAWLAPRYLMGYRREDHKETTMHRTLSTGLPSKWTVYLARKCSP